jgi:hypothetical protein
MTGHHGTCPVRTISGITCGCRCHAGKKSTNVIELFPEKEHTMAQKVITLLTDDLDGSEASQTVLFALDGKSYEIDLNDEHTEELREKLALYIGAGRKVSGGRVTVRRMGSGRPVEDTAAIRSWAKANGYEVNDRGRVPASIREAYEKANAA